MRQSDQVAPAPDPLLAKCEELLVWLHESEDSLKLRGVIRDIEILRDRLLAAGKQSTTNYR